MNEPLTLTQSERNLAGLAHAGVLVGLLTNGIGGIGIAMVIWLIQKERSAYVAAQALQALVYQVATLIVTMLAWCCWTLLWLALIMPPIFANPAAYDNALPPGFWPGLILMVIPFGIWGLTVLYGLWGAMRCLGGHDFKYAIIGGWLARQN